MDTIEIIRSGTGRILWRTDCERCVAQGKGAFAPEHDASTSCESGQRSHCSCGRCF